MPEYTFRCDTCGIPFVEIWHMSEYDENFKNATCPECNSPDIYRDFADDMVVSHVVPHLSECKTIGQYAEKQSKKYGKEKCEKMREEFKTQKDLNSGIKELPDGMSRIKNASDIPTTLTREKAKQKKRGKK